MTSNDNQLAMKNSLTVQKRLLDLEEQKQALDREIKLINSHREQTIHRIVKGLLDIAALRDSFGITQKEINNAILSIQHEVQESARTLQGVPVIDEVRTLQSSQSSQQMMGVAQPQHEETQDMHYSQNQEQNASHHHHQQQQQQQQYSQNHSAHQENPYGETNPAGGFAESDYSGMGVAQPENEQYEGVAEHGTAPFHHGNGHQ